MQVWKRNDALQYDVHFWIGKGSSQDEYATAAYKTVELDTFLKDAAIQHRELEGLEVDKFLAYFPKFTYVTAHSSQLTSFAPDFLVPSSTSTWCSLLYYL